MAIILVKIHENFVKFLEENCERCRIIPVAQNGDIFDYTMLYNSLIKLSLYNRLNSLNTLYLDNIKVFSQVYKNSTNKSLSLSNIYNSIFSKECDAHDKTY